MVGFIPGQYYINLIWEIDNDKIRVSIQYYYHLLTLFPIRIERIFYLYNIKVVNCQKDVSPPFPVNSVRRTLYTCVV